MPQGVHRLIAVVVGELKNLRVITKDGRVYKNTL